MQDVRLITEDRGRYLEKGNPTLYPPLKKGDLLEGYSFEKRYLWEGKLFLK